MTDDLVKRLRSRHANEYQTADLDALEAADRIENLSEKLSLCIKAIEAQDALKDRIEELREYLYLTANTLQDFMSFGDGINSPTWKDFCKDVIAHAKKLSRDS